MVIPFAPLGWTGIGLGVPDGSKIFAIETILAYDNPPEVPKWAESYRLELGIIINPDESVDESLGHDRASRTANICKDVCESHWWTFEGIPYPLCTTRLVYTTEATKPTK